MLFQGQEMLAVEQMLDSMCRPALRPFEARAYHYFHRLVQRLRQYLCWPWASREVCLTLSNHDGLLGPAFQVRNIPNKKQRIIAHWYYNFRELQHINEYVYQFNALTNSSILGLKSLPLDKSSPRKRRPFGSVLFAIKFAICRKEC